MKKLVLGAAALAAVLLAGVASGAPATSRTLAFTDVQQRSIAPPDPTLGDRMMFTSVIYNHGSQFGKPSGARAGRAEGVCTVTGNTPPAVQCVFTAHVPNGQLVAMGDGDPGKPVSRWAIVGGLGAYTSARGTLVITNVSPTRSLVVAHLQ
ncbi:MAG TPA: dirigent protein [Gaiellaceae bacterium]|nr:dirigent protein [Gaiellaceae bacterium]